MPKIEPKSIQRDLDQGKIWPVYWIYGLEKMKSRELTKRIRLAVLGDANAPFSTGLSQEIFDGPETDAFTILDAAKSLSLGGGTNFIVIRDAHGLKNPEPLEELMGAASQAGAKNELPWVCIFLSKDLDARKKFSKVLVEKAAVVSCEEVAEGEREAWIQYLAKRRGLEFSADLLMQISALDPWTLDIVDQELEKYSLSKLDDPQGHSAEVLLVSAASTDSGQFMDAFFSRSLKLALTLAENFSDKPDESLPLLGLLSWNVRQLVAMAADQRDRTKTVKLNPYLGDRLARYLVKWDLADLKRLQSELSQLDYGLKQTRLLPLGLWDSLITGFCAT